jgi:hypothetical protein
VSADDLLSLQDIIAQEPPEVVDLTDLTYGATPLYEFKLVSFHGLTWPIFRNRPFRTSFFSSSFMPADTNAAADTLRLLSLRIEALGIAHWRPATSGIMHLQKDTPLIRSSLWKYRDTWRLGREKTKFQESSSDEAAGASYEPARVVKKMTVGASALGDGYFDAEVTVDNAADDKDKSDETNTQ